MLGLAFGGMIGLGVPESKRSCPKLFTGYSHWAQDPLACRGVGFICQGVLTFHATVAESEAAATITWASRPRRRVTVFFQSVPQRPACVAVVLQHLGEEIRSEHSNGAMKEISLARGQVSPAPAFVRVHECDVENKPSHRLHLRVKIGSQGFQVLDVLRGDVALVQEIPEFVEVFNVVAFLARHSLAILANVIAMAAPAELLIGASAPADATPMTHFKKAARPTDRGGRASSRAPFFIGESGLVRSLALPENVLPS